MRPFLLFVLASYARVSDGKDIVAEEVRTSIVGNDDLRCAMGDLGMNRIPPMNTTTVVGLVSHLLLFFDSSLLEIGWLIEGRQEAGQNGLDRKILRDK